MQPIDRRAFTAGLFFGLGSCRLRPPSAQPDLVVTAASWSPDTPRAGETVTFNATIVNRGTAATPDGVVHRVAFEIDGAAVAWSDTHTTSIPPGASVTLAANGGPSRASTWTAVAGTHTLRAHVDDVDRIAELDETNNTLDATLTVADEPGLPDVVVLAVRWSYDDSASWQTGPIPAGSNVVFEADVRNQGTAPTPADVITGVAFIVDGAVVSWSDDHTASIPAGATVSLRANGGPDGDRYWNNAQVGTYTLRAHVDDINRYPEADQTNNTFDVSVTVASREPEGQYNLSYDNPPFYKDVIQQSWGASPGQTPVQLFWEVGRHFTNSSTMRAAKASAQSITNSGRVAMGGTQRWEDTWVRSLPRSAFTNPPAVANELYYNDPNFSAEYRAWGNWIKNRPQYWDKTSTGGTPRTNWNSWGGHWGHISPLMPLDPADIPPGVAGNTYGDWFAHKWGQTAGLSGAWGLMMSDFVDGHPHYPTTVHDFNLRIVSRFEAWRGQTVPGSSLPEKASYIKANLINSWTDFWNEGYGEFFAALVREIERNTGHAAMIVQQASRWPSWLRLQAQDHRIHYTKLPAEKMITFGDFRSMQGDRAGEPPSFMIASAGLTAGRDVRTRLASNLHSWGEGSPSFESGLTKFYPQYTGTTRTEFGNAWLKRLWFGTCWMHVARLDGTVRRGVCWLQRGYHDSGTVDAAWVAQIRGVIPRRPFGPAVYYSVAIERAIERWWGETNQSDLNSLYLTPRTLMNVTETSRVPFNYYVSDAVLNSLQPSAYPAAWIVLNRYHPSTGADLLPAVERTKLASIAPVLSSASAIAGFDNPLKFSADVVGYGFGDQSGRLIVVPTNRTDRTLNATVTVKTLPNGNYRATDLLSGAVINFSSSGGTASLPVSLARWDTRALAITTSSGGPVAWA